MKLTTTLSALGVTAMLATPAAALAQQSAPASRPEAQSATNGFGGQVQQHINQLRTQLQITPAQDAQWTQFAQVMQQNADNMHAALEQRGGQLNTMSAVQDMQSYAHLAQVHAEDMQRLAAAFQTLYSAMTPAQQQNADTVFRNRAMNRAASHGRPSPG
ncbi:MAG: Spy/CpxP family protein refolding chaperone [Acetobacteraceae bacterium]|nr:Spy/CpxP family protein refolding chaperone [Acetobacteraceae bacterium]